MTDTPKQLRILADRLESESAVGAVVCTVAAHEIERLQAALTEAAERMEWAATLFRERGSSMTSHVMLTYANNARAAFLPNN